MSVFGQLPATIKGNNSKEKKFAARILAESLQVYVAS